MAISGSSDVEALGKPPGWTHPRAMRDWLKKIPQTERIAGAVDRALQKEVIVQNEKASAPTIPGLSETWRDSAPSLRKGFNLASGFQGAGTVSGMSEVQELPERIKRLPSGGLYYEDPSVSETKPMNKTGLSSLVNTLRNELVSAKQDALSAGEEIASAVTEVKTVAEDVRRVAKDMHREAADARAALGQITNGSPD